MKGFHQYDYTEYADNISVLHSSISQWYHSKSKQISSRNDGFTNRRRGTEGDWIGGAWGVFITACGNISLNKLFFSEQTVFMMELYDEFVSRVSEKHTR